MADDHRRSVLLRFDHRRDIAGEIMEREVVHRADGGADAARLRTEHAEALCGNRCCDFVVILQVAAARGQHHDQRAMSFSDDIDPSVAGGHENARPLNSGGVTRRAAQQAHGDNDPSELMANSGDHHRTCGKRAKAARYSSAMRRTRSPAGTRSSINPTA